MVKILFVDQGRKIYSGKWMQGLLEKLCYELELSPNQVILVKDDGNVYSDITDDENAQYLYRKDRLEKSFCLQVEDWRRHIKNFDDAPWFDSRFDYQKFSDQHSEQFDVIKESEQVLFNMAELARENYARYYALTTYFNKLQKSIKYRTYACNGILQMAYKYLQQTKHDRYELNLLFDNLQQGLFRIKMQLSNANKQQLLEPICIDDILIDNEQFQMLQRQISRQITKQMAKLNDLEDGLAQLNDLYKRSFNDFQVVKNQVQNFNAEFKSNPLMVKEPQFALSHETCWIYGEFRTKLEQMCQLDSMSPHQNKIAQDLLDMRSNIQRLNQKHFQKQEIVFQELTAYLDQCKRIEQDVNQLYQTSAIKNSILIAQQLKYNYQSKIQKLKKKYKKIEIHRDLLKLPLEYEQVLINGNAERDKQEMQIQIIQSHFNQLVSKIISKNTSMSAFLKQYGDILPAKSFEQLINPVGDFSNLTELNQQCEFQQATIYKVTKQDIIDYYEQKLNIQDESAQKMIQQKQQQQEFLKEQLILKTKSFQNQKQENQTLLSQLQECYLELRALEEYEETHDMDLVIDQRLLYINQCKDTYTEQMMDQLNLLRYENKLLREKISEI